MAAPAHIARENGKKGGRPKGTTTTPQFSHYVDKKDIEKFVKHVLTKYQEDPQIAKWVGDQIFGKARQPIDGDFKGKLEILFDEAFKKDK